MPVQLNHTIVAARDPQVSASFLADILGLAPPAPFGPFLVVGTDNGVSLDFMRVEGDVTPQHYAFLIGEEQFDEIFGRVQERRLEYWADPHQTRPGEINHGSGGRGFYFTDPDGHYLEVLTRPYGSGG